ncbi:DNA topoisomerase 3-beta [Babesia sp. Xinjiang]|uniref:DNA topoisomerase 3-beta n=1 Tax=Babesia sp. Xinjiang TaxID=462227 RepID=UPI000A229055|nr:DNA topoisomerase 3-beta [Babesia sp. Xinjiang]ORM41358.1 DNA topoisomerase 3-beta [Babesia sp. Xinjiang]
MAVPKVLVVAEKPKIAETIASYICTNNETPTKRKGKSNACMSWECCGRFLSCAADFIVTSTAGHVYSAAFAPRYNNWASTDPLDLFDAEIVFEEASPENKIPQHLAYEAKGCSYLLLCLDNDREGENIAFEVIRVCRPHMLNLGTEQIYRARFSALSRDDILRSLANLSSPNKLESDAVHARQVIDLRVGCAFTRYQTKFFQGKYGDLDSTCISYGPCQTPTLSFCVDRHNAILRFQEEPYYKLTGDIAYKGSHIRLTWNRGHVFDKSVIQIFQRLLSNANRGRVVSVTTKKSTMSPPKALNTVTMLKEASSRLGMGPQKAMQTAEHLYLRGHISYPRTETDCYPRSFDWKALLTNLKKVPDYVNMVESLLKSGTPLGPQGGRDVGDHPPITPVNCVSQGTLTGEEWRLYDLVVRHFLASIAGPCKIETTVYTIEVSGETFHFSNSRLLEPGYTLVLPSSHDRGVFTVTLAKGDECEVVNLRVEEGVTSPPPLLSESDLLDAMEKHGIGTDASMATHVHNIIARNFVRLVGNRRIEPTKLGKALLDGYMQIDPELVLPSVRGAIENYCNLIAEGKADCESVIRHVCRMFRLKFEHYVSKIDRINSFFETQFTSVENFGVPMSRCGICNRYMLFLNKAPMRLFCKKCSREYSLPNGGTIRQYKGLKCPLDNFELVQFQSRARAFSLCPMCYNDPPFESFGKKGMSCVDCAHPTCLSGPETLTVTCCPEECGGKLILDVINGAPNWKFFCSLCPYKLHVCETAKKVAIVSGTECDSCGSRLAHVGLKDGSTSEGCLFCNDVMKKFLIDPPKSFNRHRRFKRRGRRPLRSR